MLLPTMKMTILLCFWLGLRQTKCMKKNKNVTYVEFQLRLFTSPNRKNDNQENEIFPWEYLLIF